MHILSQAILNLYRAARAADPDRFGEVSLKALRESLPFDAALLVLHGQEMLLSGVRISRGAVSDHFLSAVAAAVPQGGHSQQGGGQGERQSEFFMGLAHQGQSHLLFARDDQVEPASWLVLLRAPPARFSDDEHEFLASLWPHLLVAGAQNRRAALDHADPVLAQRTLALINAFGVIEAADSPMLELLALEWPEYGGQRLPRPALVALFERRVFKGHRIEIDMRRHGGYMVCSGRRISMVRMLGRSELTVAYSYAQGRSHKEIAAALKVSPNTVRNQLAAVYQKLGIHGKAELAHMLALEERRRNRAFAPPLVGGRRRGELGHAEHLLRSRKKSAGNGKGDSANGSFNSSRRVRNLDGAGANASGNESRLAPDSLSPIQRRSTE